MVLIGFVMAMTAPIELLYAIELGLGTGMVTLFITISAAGVVAVDVLGTRVITRIDARMLVAGGLLLFALSEACYGLADGAAGLLGARALQGAASAVIAGAALQVAVRAPSRPHHALGSNQGLQLLGGAFGAPVGGVIAGSDTGMDGYRLAFAACCGAGLVVAVLAWLMLPGLPPARDTGRPRIGLPSLGVPVVMRFALGLGLFGNYLRSGIENTAFPLIGNAAGLSPSEIGLALGALAAVEICVLGLSGRIFDRIPPARCLVVTLLVGIAAVAVLATSSGPGLFLVAALLFGVVDGIALAAPPVLVVALSPDPSAGIATYRIACGIGSFVGSSTVNVFIGVLGAVGGLSVVSGVLAMGALLARSTDRRVAGEAQ